MAVGLLDGKVEIYDLETKKLISYYKNHMLRVGALDWTSNCFTSGSKDSKVVNHDLRAKDSAFMEFKGHTLEICGLKWNNDGSYLATGSNDNKVCIWSLDSNKPIDKITKHEAAVKALDWSPRNRSLLATGGGCFITRIG